MSAAAGWRDTARFLRGFFGDPRVKGAVAPSGRALAKAMAAQVDPAPAGPVVELGPGTGPVTRALLARGLAPERLVLVEWDGDFCRLLAARHAGVRVVQGDAYSIEATLAGRLDAPPAAIVSSLPLLNEAPARRVGLLDAAFRMLAPGGVFVQFTYGPRAPVEPAPDAAYAASASPRVWLNAPPAQVWTYRRRG
ncbi:MAG: phospholipid methyltransferase [Hyphomicrobiales bacterium]|nr:phospholipid methyltransferase [Hyphomicrobiales bacterium]